MNLLEFTDKLITTHNSGRKVSGYFYPSEASVISREIDGSTRVIGGCIRKSYYRLTNKGQDALPMSARGEYICQFGKDIEDSLMEFWRYGEVLAGTQVEFRDENYNISGKIDGVLKNKETGGLIGVEVKTIYSYMADATIIGTVKRRGQPKDQHLLQTLLYRDHFKEYEAFKLFYIDRGNAKRIVYDVAISDPTPDPITGRMVRLPLYKREENITYELVANFSMEDIYDRFALLGRYIKEDVVPPRDYDYAYTEDKAKRYFQLGLISKTKMENFYKGKTVGDFQCSYCDYRKLCYAGEAIQPPTDEDDDE